VLPPITFNVLRSITFNVPPFITFNRVMRGADRSLAHSLDPMASASASVEGRPGWPSAAFRPRAGRGYRSPAPLFLGPALPKNR